MNRPSGSDKPRRRLHSSETPDDVTQAVDAEVQFHIGRRTEALMAQGLSREDAEREARRRFGDVDRVRQTLERGMTRRAAWARVADWLTQVRTDVRFALRQLRRSPGFTFVAITTLALGIGASTAIFSVVDGILFKPLAFNQPDRLVNAWTDVTRRGGPDDEWLSWSNFEDLRDQVTQLDALAAWGGASPVLTGRSEARQLLAAVVSEGMFSRVLPVEPILGRSFNSEDHQPGPGTVLLSYGMWRDELGSDPDVVGTTLVLDDEATTVIGVLPEGFRPPFVPDAELWVPTQVDSAAVQRLRGNFSWRAVGRLAPNVTLETANTEVAALGQRLEAQYPESNTGMGFRLVGLRDDLVADSRTGLLTLLGAVGFVLLVACVNIANLLLARASSRKSELAVRTALGAGRSRIVRQLFTESLILAVLGGLAGLALAVLGTDLLVSLAPANTPRLSEISVDARALGAAAAITLLAGFVFGLAPAIHGSGYGVAGALKEAGRGSGEGRRGGLLRSALVSGQVALALVLLVGSGLLMQSFVNLRSRDLGFRPQGVISMGINLPPSRYPDADTRRAFYAALEERLAALPGVQSVAFTSTVPLTGFDGDVDFLVEGRPVPEPGRETVTWFRRVTPGYFETMGIAIVEGRAFDQQDGATAPRVVIVNETLARRQFPGESAVGKRINVNGPDSPVWREIVGVAADIRNFGIREESRMAMYAPYDQLPNGFVFPVLRTELPPDSVVPLVRRGVAGIDPNLAVAQVLTMDEIVSTSIAQDRVVTMLLSFFAGAGLLLAFVGLYGVVSYGVNARRREIGIRVALGADAARVRRLVVSRSLALAGIGVLVGLAGAAGLTQFMQGLLFGVGATDLSTFAAVTLVLGLAAFVASLVPAVRATRVDPVEVLKAE